MHQAGEDNSQVGRATPQPAADADSGHLQIPQPSVVGHGLRGAAIGALIGFGLGVLVMPGVTAALMIGGAMSGAAIRVGWLVLTGARAEQDE